MKIIEKQTVILLAIALVLFVLSRIGQLDFVYRLANKFFWQKEKEPVGELCERETLELRMEIARLKEENQASRRLLEADLPPGFKFIPAHLIGTANSRFRLDVGTADEVSEGSWVVVENTALGIIDKVGPFVSEGLLVKSGSFKTAVNIWRDEGGENLVGKGLLSGGERPVVEEILPEEEVAEGDLVAIMQRPEILIGEVVEVEWEEGRNFKKALVDRLLNPRTVSTVFVLK